MSIARVFKGCMRLPVIAAPMFLVSGPGLVLAACKGSVAGDLSGAQRAHARDSRPMAGRPRWRARGAPRVVAAGALRALWRQPILHPSNARVKPDLELLVKHRVPFVITSLGHPGEVVEAVRSYGGLVFST